ncbi:helix-turn-helix transcriptional regulator [Desulfosporosinus shakirovi]|uniref:helix-turn-helix transcriptional regulator n=1 Tax=Desulfosporosinus shakirovi TaxID=2885154 RepID=UPI001E422F24|nr:helix-turn-helix transcriptional regulator [Desulfosporosinus sp. SRJS8]MCB8817405.1 helix-turn-helix domain-containing protein [Desulfosporosinus sp. SRJS8]
MHSDINKDNLMVSMADNLVVLRKKFGLTQAKLADKIGIGRQTLIDIEKKKRPMTWNTFVALLLVFRANCGTSDLLDYFGIYTIELNNYLTSSDSVSND